jgi:hypothetical protein
MDKSISEFSIFTMLGGRASVIDLHLKSLAKHTSKSTKKICLLPPNHRTKTLALCSKYGDDFEFVSREKFGFHLKPTPDVNYDRLFKEKCITSKFIFIHDDTILLSPLENYLKKKFVDYDFVGAIDNAVKPGQFNQKFYLIKSQWLIYVSERGFWLVILMFIDVTSLVWGRLAGCFQYGQISFFRL